MSNVALIVAGGSGSRMSSSIPKQYQQVSGEPILRKTIKKFLAHPQIDDVLVVIGKDHEDFYNETTKGLKLLSAVIGGSTRQESVRKGLESLKDLNPDNVLIHDAARPFVSQKIITNVLSQLNKFKAVDVGVTPKDTIKQKSRKILTMERNGLYCTQTPQGFDYRIVHDLHQKYNDENCTDDISLAIMDSIEIGFVAGEYSNIKITTTEDLNMSSITKVGMGYDVHKFDLSDKANHTVPICGVHVPHEYKVIAHSDGDVGLHALMDAMLGTAALGDIGVHFPPTDNKWKDANSLNLLEHVNDLVNSHGGVINNIDITIICEAPKLIEYKDEMKKVVARTLKINENLVNVKATTTEKLGFTGRGEGIAAQAICSIKY